ncbi:MAG: TMEM165/GDT1 family protein [Candidatus Limnocylindria bacterium]
MLPFLSAAAIAFGAIFVAEFGDKSQLLILAFATRFPWRPVVAGLVLAAALIQGLSVVIGALVGAALPATAVAVVSGIAFLAVAAWTLRGEDDDEEEEEDAPGTERGGRLAGLALVTAVAGAFVAAELGDKTMLATFALAAQQGALPTWIGSTAGEVAANLVAVVVGRQVGHRLSPRLVRIGSAVLFAVAGLVILAGVVLGQPD